MPRLWSIATLQCTNLNRNGRIFYYLFVSGYVDKVKVIIYAIEFFFAQVSLISHIHLTLVSIGTTPICTAQFVARYGFPRRK